jgi:hypothetical protein
MREIRFAGTDAQEAPILDKSLDEADTCGATLSWAAHHGEEAMKTTVLFSALALGALTSAARAGERTTLTDGQMDKITAGASQAQDLIVAPSARHGANVADEKAGQNLAISPYNEPVSGPGLSNEANSLGNTYRNSQHR